MEIGLTLVPTTSALSLSNTLWLRSCCFYFYPRSPPSLLLPLVLLSRLVLADSTTLSHFFLPSWPTARPPPAHLSQAGATLLLPAPAPAESHRGGRAPPSPNSCSHNTHPPSHLWKRGPKAKISGVFVRFFKRSQLRAGPCQPEPGSNERNVPG